MTAVAVRGGWGATGWDDPAMGDIASVRALSARFQHRAVDLRALNVELTQGLAGLGGWQGQAAERFRENQQRLRLGLDSFVDRFEKCRMALDSYAHAMDERRVESNALLPRVLDAKRRLAAAQHDILHPPSVAALSRGLAMQPILIAELDGLGIDWSGIRGRHMASAAWCAQQLQDSDGNVLQDLFRDAGAVIRAGQQKLGDLALEVDQWLTDNANTIAALSDVLGDIGTVVSLLPIPGAAAVGLAISATSLVGKIVARQHGAAVSDADLAFSVLGLVGGGVVLRATRIAPTGIAARILSKRVDRWGKGIEVGSRMMKMDAGENPFKYWTPTSARSVAVGLGAGLPAMAFWNAFEDGHAADLKARQARPLSGVPACS